MSRISRVQLLLLVLVIALVGLSAYCVMIAVQKASAASDLDSQVGDVQNQISKVNAQYDVEGLQAQLDSLQAEVEAAQFPTQEEVENIQVLDLVIEAQDEAGIQVESFWPDQPTAVSLNNNDTAYTAFVHAVTAMSANVSGLYEFLDAIESNAPFMTLVIDGVALELVPATEEEPPHWTMDCNVIVYAQN